jgi:hypothetical protein
LNWVVVAGPPPLLSQSVRGETVPAVSAYTMVLMAALAE